MAGWAPPSSHLGVAPAKVEVAKAASSPPQRIGAASMLAGRIKTGVGSFLNRARGGGGSEWPVDLNHRKSSAELDDVDDLYGELRAGISSGDHPDENYENDLTDYDDPTRDSGAHAGGGGGGGGGGGTTNPLSRMRRLAGTVAEKVSEKVSKRSSGGSAGAPPLPPAPDGAAASGLATSSDGGGGGGGAHGGGFDVGGPRWEEEWGVGLIGLGAAAMERMSDVVAFELSGGSGGSGGGPGGGGQRAPWGLVAGAVSELATWSEVRVILPTRA